MGVLNEAQLRGPEVQAFYAPTVGKGEISVAFVHPSLFVCPYVALSWVELCRYKHPFRCDSHTSFKVKGQG